MTTDLSLLVELPPLPDGLGALTEALTATAESWRSETGFTGRCLVDVQSRAEPGFVVRAAGTRLVMSGLRWTEVLAVTSPVLQRPTSWTDPAAEVVELVWRDHPDLAPRAAAVALRSQLRVCTRELLAAAGAPLPESAPGLVGVELAREHIRDLLLDPDPTQRTELAAVRREFAHRFGVTPPGLRFVEAPWSVPVVQLHLGGEVTPPIRLEPAYNLGGQLRWVLWTEYVRHLALWVDDEAPGWSTGLPDLPETAASVSAYLPALRRRLLSDQVSVVHDTVLVESVLRVLAAPGRDMGAEDGLLDVMEDRVRRALGTALAVSALEEPRPVVEVDVTGAPTGLGPLRDDLVTRCPTLFATHTQTLFRVSQERRREVAEALRPLGEVVQVVGDDELVPTRAGLDRWRVVETERAVVG